MHLTHDVVYSSEIEGIRLNVDDVRSSIARKLGIENVKYTAIRDIQDLADKNILCLDIPGAKRPSYSIIYDSEDLTQFFTDVSITEEKLTSHLLQT